MHFWREFLLTCRLVLFGNDWTRALSTVEKTATMDPLRLAEYHSPDIPATYPILHASQNYLYVTSAVGRVLIQGVKPSRPMD